MAECARWVRIDDDALVKLAADLASADEPFPDPVHRPFGDEATTLAFVLTLDAVNFGSGWFPELRKRPGRSGYFSIATGLRERFEAAGPLPAAALVDTNSEDCAEMFGQRGAGEGAAELMELFARALRELGAWLLARYAGRFEGPVEAAGGSAARLVEALAEMPLYRDVSRYQGFEVPFFKRAQITASDLATAFGARGYGRFDDLRHLTIFADNLVPHVLRCEGVLVYATELAERVDAGELLPHGSPEEVEIRGLAAHTVAPEAAARIPATQAEAFRHLWAPARLGWWVAVVFTVGSRRINKKASLTFSLSAPPPASRKLAGLPPQDWIMSRVAMASPAPFTMQPMLPSSPT